MSQTPPQPPASQDASGRRERAQRILDVTGELILRWGYQRTTIDDIAKRSGVGKGTIYLHWKTREALFQTLMRREQLAMAQEFRRLLSADPNGAMPQSVIKYTALALMSRPLLKAFLLRDSDVLGKMAETQMSNSAYAARVEGFKAYIQFLREHDLVRQDLSLLAQVHIWSAVFAGFFLGTPLMPGEFQRPDVELAELMAEVIHRAIETDRPVTPDEQRALAGVFSDYVNRTTALAEEQFAQELAS